jgi:hypothetical protein
MKMQKKERKDRDEKNTKSLGMIVILAWNERQTHNSFIADTARE